MPQTSFISDTPHGPLPQGYQVNLEGNYIVLVGANNAGKTSLLQLLFRKNYPQLIGQGKSQTCLILPERIYIDMTTETGGRALEQYNHELASSMGGENRSYQSWTSPASSELARLLLNHADFYTQLGKMNEYLEYLGFPKFKLQGRQEITFDDIRVIVNGTGLRSIFVILAALTDDCIKLLLIDEPELSLEPRLQKLLRDLLYQASKEKQIIITTQSHLFLNRINFQENYVVKKENNSIFHTAVSSEVELYEITFKLLGSSLEDLFFPSNFLVVEGYSDQIIVNKVMELLGVRSKIKVVAATGVDNVPNILSAINNTLLPLSLNDSPYKNIVVALIDKPTDANNATYLSIKKHLKDRLIELDAVSIEEYLPVELYVRCNRDKNEDLKDIAKAKKAGDYLGLLGPPARFTTLRIRRSPPRTAICFADTVYPFSTASVQCCHSSYFSTIPVTSQSLHE